MGKTKGRARLPAAGRIAAFAAASLLFLWGTVIACGQEREEGEEGGAARAVAASTCLSGMRWAGGNSESPEMHPGISCIDCHSRGEGPSFLIAGTVYQQFNEADDCYGVQGAEVQITDSKGQVIRLTTNRAGNFFLRSRGSTLAIPIKAAVVYKGMTRAMATPRTTGNCLQCHTAKGANGAPGRIVGPSS